MKKTYIPARMEEISFGNDDIVRTSLNLGLDLPGVDLPEIDLTELVKDLGKAMEADEGISPIE